MIRKVAIIVMMMMLFFTPAYNAMTIAETEDKIAKMQADMQKEQEKAANAQMTYDELDQEMRDMAEEQKQIEQDIIDIENEMAAKEAEIAETEAEIARIESELPALMEQANAILRMFQTSSNQNYLIDQLFGDNDGGEATAIRKTTALNTLTQEAVDILNHVIAVQQELEAQKVLLEEQKVELDEQQNDLAYQQAYLDEQIALSKAMQAEQKAVMAESEVHIDEGVSDIAAQQDLINLMESAGCGPNDVYMVDCGLPPAPEEGGPSESTGFNRPMASGYVTAEYGDSDIDYYCGYHNGIDLSSNNKTEAVYSVASGQVISVMSESESGGYGNYVIIQHNINGTIYYSKYAHLSSVNVSEGQYVDGGSQIGNMGNTGMSYGSHLHLSIQQGGGAPSNCSTINPRSVIDFPPIYVYWEGL